MNINVGLGHLFTLRQIQEKCRECNTDIQYMFVPFQQAFGKVNRKTFTESHVILGIPRKFKHGTDNNGRK